MKEDTSPAPAGQAEERMIEANGGKYAVCLGGGRWHGWAFERINGNWVSIRKATPEEVTMAENAETVNAAGARLYQLLLERGASAPRPEPEILVVWRDDPSLGAFITTRKHPDDSGVNGAQCWPRGIAGCYLATHCRTPVFHSSALPFLPGVDALVAAVKLAVREAGAVTGETMLSPTVLRAMNAAIGGAGGWRPEELAELEALMDGVAELPAPAAPLSLLRAELVKLLMDFVDVDDGSTPDEKKSDFETAQARVDAFLAERANLGKVA